MKNKPRNLLYINYFLIFATLICAVGYHNTKGLAIKTAASGFFVLIGLINWLYTRNRLFSPVMFAGVVFAFLGDVVLEVNFMGGAMLFALGHVFYFIAYCKLERWRREDFFLPMIIFLPVAGLILFLPVFDFGGLVMQMVCVIYALVIAFMLGKAWTNYQRQPSTLTMLLLVGSFLFFFSDFMLLFNRFANISTIFFTLCVGTYYPGQLILSYSLLHAKKNRY